MKVNEQIDQFGGDTAGVVIILTDGHLGDGIKARRQVSYTGMSTIKFEKSSSYHRLIP